MQVWCEAPLQVTAVEPSPSMSWLGQRVWAAQQEAHAEAMARLAQQQKQQQGEGQAGGGGRPQVQWQATWAGRELAPERLERWRDAGSSSSSSSGAARATAATAGQPPAGEGPGAGGWEAAAGGAVGLGCGAESDAQSENDSEESEQRQEEEALLPVPRVRWMSRLAPRSRAQGRQYGLVVAAYVLGEMRGEEERRCAWRVCVRARLCERVWVGVGFRVWVYWVEGEGGVHACVFVPVARVRLCAKEGTTCLQSH